MDRKLLERVIGAAVLVIVVVLVVPVFLDGPDDPARTISEPVLLPGQGEQPSRTVLLERDRDEPVPIGEPAAAADPATADDSSAAAQPRPQDATTTSSATDPANAGAPASATTSDDAGAATDDVAAAVPAGSSTGMWAVQLGSFSSRDNAERLATSLRREGFAAFLSRLDGDDGTLHRVRVGPQQDRASAEQMAARLKNAGHSGKVLPHP